MNRHEKRALESRGNALLAKLTPMQVSDPERSIAIVEEGSDLQVVDVNTGLLTLMLMGLADAVQHIVAERARRPNTLPTVVIVGGFASIAFVRVLPMSAGGSA